MPAALASLPSVRITSIFNYQSLYVPKFAFSTKCSLASSTPSPSSLSLSLFWFPPRLFLVAIRTTAVRPLP
ncbi:hypothetical protein AN958_03930 [Leucoagaricus sp. SymC.cos]|nr:hypothetical protein AN958_03930 [Leucoagaricus sp. SymC.cos]